MAYIRQGWQWIGHTPRQTPTQAARAAYRLVHSRLRKGWLVRPDTGEECGGSRRRIEAAHSDYSRPLADPLAMHKMPQCLGPSGAQGRFR